MQNRKWIKRVIIGMIVVVVLVVVIVLVINLIPKKYDRVNVENVEVVSNVKGDDFNSFRLQLLDLLISQELISEDAKVDDVVIRDDSVASFTEISGSIRLKQTTFLVDIDSVKQTYRVNIYDGNQSMTDSPVQISCPLISEMKYPEEKCSGVYGYGSNSVQLRIPYEFKLDSGEKVLVKKIDSLDNGRMTLQIYLYSCNNNNPPLSKTREVVKKWVDNLGDPAAENYNYNVRTGYCEGDAI